MFNYGEVGAFNLAHENPTAGFAGLVDTSDYNKATAGVCFESRSRTKFHYETYTFATNPDRNEARENAIWRDRARTATTGFSNSYKAGISNNMYALVAKSRKPALVAEDLQNFQINSWDDDDWYEPLMKMWQDHGNSSWVLQVGDLNYGRVGLYNENDYIFLYASVPYSLINTNGKQIVLHSPQIWNVNTSLDFDDTQVETLLVPVTDQIKENRNFILKNKPDWKPYRFRPTTRKENRMLAYMEAAVLGHLASGLGAGISQTVQNRWWNDQFEKNRAHEMEMMNKKMDFSREQMNAKKAYDQKNKSLEMGQQAVSAGLTHVPEDKSLSPTETHSTGLKPVVPQPNGNGPAQPKLLGPGESAQTDTQILGLNNTDPQMYHPTNLMQSSDLNNPIQVSNAENSYTESMKRGPTVSNA